MRSTLHSLLELAQEIVRAEALADAGLAQDTRTFGIRRPAQMCKTSARWAAGFTSYKSHVAAAHARTTGHAKELLRWRTSSVARALMIF